MTRSDDASNSHRRKPSSQRRDRKVPGPKNDPSKRNSYGPRKDRTVKDESRRFKSDRPIRKVRIEPSLPEDVEAKMLPGKLRVELLSLSAENSEVVARQLVMIDRLLASGADSDLTLAHQFGKAASERAGRVGIVRFYAGRAALSIRDFAEAKKHFSAALRINGAALMKVFLAECENGLGKSRKSLELLGEIKPGELSSRDWAYAHLISAEARESMGQHEAAWVTLSKKHEDLLTKLPVEDSAFVLRWQALKNRVAINLGKHSD